MDTIANLASYSLPAFIFSIFAVQVIAREIGLWFGRRHAVNDSALNEGVGVIVGSMLGLLAFVLALTLSSSTARFQERRQSMLVEAGAISSAWSRAEAINDPKGDEIARALVDYTAIRREYAEAPADAELLADIEHRSAALQRQIWNTAAEITRNQPNPLTVSLLNNVDAAFSAATNVRFAFSTRMMPQLFWLLIGMTAATVAGMGYQTGIRRKTLRKISLLILAMWTAVITDILDLGTARIGNIGNDASVYGWVSDGFGAGEAGP